MTRSLIQSSPQSKGGGQPAISKKDGGGVKVTSSESENIGGAAQFSTSTSDDRVNQSLFVRRDSSMEKDAVAGRVSSSLLPKKLALRQPDICSSFPALARTRTSQEIAVDQMMEDEIKCQSQKERDIAARVQKLREKFSDAAQLKMNVQGKELRWSTQGQDGTKDKVKEQISDAESGRAAKDDQLSPPSITRGHRGKKATKLVKLQTQLMEQERIAATATALAVSLRTSENPEGGSEVSKVVPLGEAEGLDMAPAQGGRPVLVP